MKTRRIPVLTFALLLPCIAFGATGCGAAESPGEISQQELRAAIEAQRVALVLDVRTPEEYASGHVPGARNLPIDQLAGRSGELAAWRDQPVVVYCERGPRAAKAAAELAAAGFTSVRSLAGHMSAWREAGLRTE